MRLTGGKSRRSSTRSTSTPPISVLLKKIPNGDVFEASHADDVDRFRFLLDSGLVNVNARDRWDSVAHNYDCLASQFDTAPMLLESGAICSDHTFDSYRCQYAAAAAVGTV
ncbi:hypothetical protein Dsin_000808 [Dipteronia sinensis]|uniref:Uncharacterized protein n=1 Tax=Dipteronia sinensis TaxID=43782 RepID=A0AAE0B3X4_9ROSI|nr:hypothetical protein Dsin_000808 [Dipteronia sinensis]